MSADDIKTAAGGETAPGTMSEAATTDDAIKAALAKLDPTNDDHWTSTGKPAMDAVNALLPAPITRARLDEVAPDFDKFTKGGQIESNKLPAGAIGTWVEPPSAGGQREGDGVAEGDDLSVGGQTAVELDDVGFLHHRIDALEADVAFLRKQFGWPTKGD